MNGLSLYLSDIVAELRVRAREASQGNSDFDRGRALAFAEVLQHMQNQADVFGIERSTVGLDGFDPMSDFARTSSGP